jgi:hypothetical protein
LKPLMFALAVTLVLAFAGRIWGAIGQSTGTLGPPPSTFDGRPRAPRQLRQPSRTSGKKPPSPSTRAAQRTRRVLEEVEKDGVLDPFD